MMLIKLVAKPEMEEQVSTFNGINPKEHFAFFYASTTVPFRNFHRQKP